MCDQQFAVFKAVPLPTCDVVRVRSLIWKVFLLLEAVNVMPPLAFGHCNKEAFEPSPSSVIENCEFGMVFETAAANI